LQWSAYSLAKACIEHTVRLLAPELARKKITVNAVCPGFLPVGINKQSTARQRLTESASVPIGRLCEPDDVIAMVIRLLGDDFGFVSGQVIGLTGGQI
jgi:NAD(P)-dependent dehydrogenase (short-subunit alcohol dehydrogenase family)